MKSKSKLLIEKCGLKKKVHTKVSGWNHSISDQKLEIFLFLSWNSQKHNDSNKLYERTDKLFCHKVLKTEQEQNTGSTNIELYLIKTKKIKNEFQWNEDVFE